MSQITRDGSIRIRYTAETDDLISRLRRSLTIPNPAWAAARKRGLRAYGIDQHLRLYRTQKAQFIAPRGCDLGEYADQVTHQETLEPCPYFDLRAELRPYQQAAVDEISAGREGLLVAPTGSGKTVMGCALIARSGQRALILVHTRALQDQWREAIQRWLGLTAGVVGGGRFIEEAVTIATVQTLDRGSVSLGRYGCVIADEAHHTPARSWLRVLGELPAAYRYGLSATPSRRDGLDCLLPLAFGPRVSVVDRSAVEDAGGIVSAIVQRHRSSCTYDGGDWQAFMRTICGDSERTASLAALAAESVSAGGSVLILTRYVEHAEAIASALAGSITDVNLAHGRLGVRQRREAMARLGSASVTVATIALLGEGVDCPGWDTLVLASPLTSRGGTLQQAVGRVLRPADGKRLAAVIDVVDRGRIPEACWRGRRTVYRRLGFEVQQ